jgi:hypothetical protein
MELAGGWPAEAADRHRDRLRRSNSLQPSQVYSLFEAIFVLVVDKGTLRHRLLSRTENDYGKHPDELAGILSYHPMLERELLSAPGAVAIDATKPLDAVVNEIIVRTRPNATHPPGA